MKKSLLKFTFIITLLSGFLVGCDKANFRFVNGKEGLWGNEDYRFNEDDYDDWWDDFDDDWFDDEDDEDDEDDYTPGGSYDPDKEPFKYNLYLPDLADDEVGITTNANYCKDENLVIPATYVHNSITHKVVRDYGNGISYLSCKTMTLPDGFKKIAVGIANCTSMTKLTIPSSLTSIVDYGLTNCTKLTTIEYKGTQSQWNAIQKGVSWNYLVPSNMVVMCTDGNLTNQGWNA